MNILLTTVAAILIFAVMIFVHELGHFLAAKATGVRVNEFALGMGPKLFSKTKGETVYSIRCIPIGGFCAMEGEDEDTGTDRAFSRKKPHIRLLILVAGAFMNILLGFILVLFMAFPADKYVSMEVASVVEGGAAQEAGLLPGDEIIRANGNRTHIMEDLRWTLTDSEGDSALNLVVKNQGERRNLSIVPKETENGKSYGIVFAEKDNNIFSSFRNAVYRTTFYGSVVIESFVGLLRGQIPMSSVSGPVGIVSEIGNAVEQTRTAGMEGLLNLLFLTVILTVNLGVFNLLPLPALDGGRILFVLIEMIRRKPIPVEKEAVVHLIGLVLFIALSVVIAFKDVITIWG